MRALTGTRTLCLGGLIAGIGMALAVIRATRAQEDSGQAELLASGVMGRGARLATGVLIGAIGSVLIGVVAGAATVVSGGGSTPSWLMAATWTVTGLMLTGLAAVAGELASDRRTASAIAIGILGALYALRGVSYSLTLPDWTVWANPLGWMTETDAATDARWWPLLLGVALAVVLVAAAFVLLGRRDFGQGVIVPGPGPAVGRVRSALVLVTRLTRGSVITWAAVAVLLGSVFGYMTSSVADILEGNTAVQAILASGATSEEGLTTAFLVTILSLLGIILSVPGIQVMLRVRSEEMEDRLEPLLATGLSRRRYYAVQAVFALCLSAALQLIAGVMLGIVAHAAGSTVTVADAARQALVTVPPPPSRSPPSPSWSSARALRCLSRRGSAWWRASASLSWAPPSSCRAGRSGSARTTTCPTRRSPTRAGPASSWWAAWRACSPSSGGRPSSGATWRGPEAHPHRDRRVGPEIESLARGLGPYPSISTVSAHRPGSDSWGRSRPGRSTPSASSSRVLRSVPPA